jgi:hypothetical protein
MEICCIAALYPAVSATICIAAIRYSDTLLIRNICGPQSSAAFCCIATATKGALAPFFRRTVSLPFLKGSPTIQAAPMLDLKLRPRARRRPACDRTAARSLPASTKPTSSLCSPPPPCWKSTGRSPPRHDGQTGHYLQKKSGTAGTQPASPGRSRRRNAEALAADPAVAANHHAAQWWPPQRLL